MRLYNIIFSGIIITMISVGYVHQRVEIVKAGYELQESRECLSGLVDQNSKLMYNLLKLESPRNLLASLNNEKIEFAGLRTKQDTGGAFSLSRTDPVKASAVEGLVGRFLDIFATDAEASPR